MKEGGWCVIREADGADGAAASADGGANADNAAGGSNGVAPTAEAGDGADGRRIVRRRRRDVGGGGLQPIPRGWVRHGERHWRLGGDAEREMLAIIEF